MAENMESRVLNETLELLTSQLQQQEELEDKEAPQESRKDVVGGAVDEQLASDPQKESVPPPGENPKGHLEGPLQQEEELEDKEAPQKSQSDIEERAVDEPLDSDPRKEFGSSPRENSSVHIKVLDPRVLNVTLDLLASQLQQQEELDDKEAPQKSQKDVVGGAVDVPSPRENPKGHLKVLPEPEQETEEAPQGSTTAEQKGAAGEPLSHDAKGQFLPQPGEKREHLEVIVNVVPSVYSPDRCEPVTSSPKSRRPESPEEHLQEDSCYLREDEGLLEDCGASMGYFSFYHTSSRLRPYRAKGGDSSCSGKPLQPQSSGESLAETEDKRGTPPPIPPTPSRQSSSSWTLNNLVLCMRNIFKRSTQISTEPSALPRTRRSRWNLGHRFQRWIKKHRPRVQPHPC